MNPLSLFRRAAEITQSILKMNKDVEINKNAIELQNIIISLQNEMFSMQSEQSKLLQIKYDLEKKLMECENWDKIKSQYELKEVNSGRFVYAPKPDSNLSEPDHWLCTNCFNDGKKSILQPKISKTFCPKCKMEIIVFPKKKLPSSAKPILNP